MSNEPKRPNDADYKHRVEYAQDINRYCDHLEAEVERLQSELARCKSERLGVEGILNELIERGGMIAPYPFNVIIDKAMDFRASQLNADQTQEGKG